MFAALHVVIGEKAGVLLSCATCLGSVVKVIVLEPIAVWCFRAPATVLQGASSNAVLQGASYSLLDALCRIFLAYTLCSNSNSAAISNSRS